MSNYVKKGFAMYYVPPNGNSNNSDKNKNANTTNTDISRNSDKKKKVCLVLRSYVNDK